MANMVQVRRTGGNSFREAPQVKIGRSQFNRSHGIKTTFDASWLVPILVDEVLPGDTFTLKMNGFARVFSPLDAPIMDNIELETFFFFVPTRLLWDNWEYFNGAHDAAGAQDTDYTIPVMASTTVNWNNDSSFDTLAGFMGIPEGLQTGQVPISSLPFRAYTLIYAEWFRDQNLIDSPTIKTDNSADSISTHPMRKRAKKHDYFTSCLPYLQKGDEVSVALTGAAPVLGIGVSDQVFAGSSVAVYETDTGSTTFTYAKGIDPATTSTSVFVEGSAASGGDLQIYADLSAVSGVSINALRESVAIQRLLERDARGGTRYVELIKSHFGVTSPDYRLQRPEYLGGGKSYINVSAVANTSSTGTEYHGSLAGVGTGTITGHGFAKSFTEHGYIIGLVNARADVTYQRGVERFWSRETRYDFYIPALANLGEQAVLNKEIYWSNTPATDDAVFGYQERWAEYRYKPSRITGKFLSDAQGTLDYWHLAEDFGSLPALNQTFIEDQTPMARVTTVDTEPDFILDAWFDYKCARPLPVYSVPSLTSMRF